MVRGKEQKKNLLVSSFAPTDSLPPDNIPQPPLDQSVVGPSVLLSTIPVLLPPCGAADAAFEPPPRLRAHDRLYQARSPFRPLSLPIRLFKRIASAVASNLGRRRVHPASPGISPSYSSVVQRDFFTSARDFWGSHRRRSHSVPWSPVSCSFRFRRSGSQRPRAGLGSSLVPDPAGVILFSWSLLDRVSPRASRPLLRLGVVCEGQERRRGSRVVILLALASAPFVYPALSSFPWGTSALLHPPRQPPSVSQHVDLARRPRTAQQPPSSISDVLKHSGLRSGSLLAYRHKKTNQKNGQWSLKPLKISTSPSLLL